MLVFLFPRAKPLDSWPDLMVVITNSVRFLFWRTLSFHVQSTWIPKLEYPAASAVG